MNKDRRKEIAELIQTLAGIASQIDDLKTQVEAVRDDEQDYYDNMPESFQMADRGYAAEAAVSALENALSALEDFDADDIASELETAAE